jgi:hypothetical protein
LIFKNGDRLTGTVVGLADGKITFDAAVVGKVTASLEEMESFSSEDETEVHLGDGTIVIDRILRDRPGTVHLAGDPSRALELGEIEAVNPEKVAWHGSLAAGLTVGRGDTDKQEGNAEFRTRWTGDLYRFRLRLLYEGDRSRTNGGDYETNDRLYRGRAQLDRMLGDRLFVYSRLRGERDGVADLDLRTAAGTGFGYKLVDRPGLTFEFQSGLAWVHEDYEDDSRDTDFPAGVIAWDLEKILRAGIRFFHDGEWNPSLRDFNDIQLLRTETGLRFDIVKGWFAEAKVRWELDTEPSSGKERTNADYIFALGWGF